MLDIHLQNSILSAFPFSPTSDQQKAAKVLAGFMTNTAENKIIVLNGYAGTGKTSLISAFIKVLDDFNHNSVLLAPTGRAAKVLSSYCGKPSHTIHRYIYRQKGGSDLFSAFDIGFNKRKETVFIVDEASMISNSGTEYSGFGSGRLLDDLIQFVYSGTRCSLVLIGDKAQLPPVGTELSPALDADYLHGYNLEATEFTLKEVVRQNLNSGILYNATKIRDYIEHAQNGYPSLEQEGFPDFNRITGGELIDSLNDSYDKVGVEETLVITRSNKMANRYNMGIRSSILYREEQLTQGDRVMIVKNNYLYGEQHKKLGFIANGDIAEVGRVSGHTNLYDYHFCNTWLTFPGEEPIEIEGKLLLETLTSDGPSIPYNDLRKLYDTILEDYPNLRNKKEKATYMKTDEFYNALQVKFAYAITCHKSQGGQWKHIYIDLGYYTEEMLNTEFYRWLYTAITRATEKVYLVNFKDEFFA